MRWWRLVLVSVFVAGCGNSHTVGDDPAEDSGIIFDPAEPADAGAADAGPPPGDDADVIVPPTGECGDGMLNPMEQCDDGNGASGDGCDGDCHWESFCGDGTTDSGEECDDGNAISWDGCGADCRVERSLIIDELRIASASEGCDYSGDGEPDNSFASALGPVAGLADGQISGAIEDGSVIFLMAFLGLDDPSAVNDDSVTVGWIQGEDTDGSAGNNFSGSGRFYGTMASFTPDGDPAASFESAIMSRTLGGGPEDIEIPVGGFFNLELRGGRVHGTTTAAASGELSGISAGLLCGSVPVSTFATIPNVIDMFLGGSPAPSCDGSGLGSNMADVIVAGTPQGFIFTLAGTQPDVDLDGDGLEAFEIVRTGPEGCQPVIVACVDGDGTRVEGHTCATNPRFQDGFSAALNFTAVGADIVGIR